MEKNFSVVEGGRSYNSNKTWVLLKDFVSGVILPIHTDIPCFWCREQFDNSPIGLPLRFVKHRETGILAERMNEHLRLFNLPTDHGNEHFETEGNFCSFGCCKAYMLDEMPKNPERYRKSPGLLVILHLKLEGVLSGILAAPSWKVLKKWGGKLSIEEFRSNPNLKRYEISPNTKRPYMYCTGRYVEERDL
ncbi:putative zinc finger/DNA-binding protein [Brazilian marseillevirus]|uniref:putative zinc finger/DNA-binding protein n=1 Tax=Brazilian marseillevirus TaxID=1813599 RepID=UPI000783A9CB|nr:putative zinc finger/DNA-binding protein [Brazilian marseillevirus]AMQ10790.1 putative zinc finger/DNA-binding protein [Brazilian marseillevirus]